MYFARMHTKLYHSCKTSEFIWQTCHLSTVHVTMYFPSMWSLRSQVVYLQTVQTWANAGVVFLSRINESITGYTFTPCVGSFTSPGIDTR